MIFSVLLEWTVCAMMQAQVTPALSRAGVIFKSRRHSNQKWPSLIAE